MNLRGHIGEQDIVFLVDCGSTHNFIHQRLVEELHLSLSETTNNEVVMWSGEAKRWEGICRDVMIVLPEMTMTKDFLPSI